MYSIEEELIPYTKVIDPVASKGQVEDWLVQVEEIMIKSVKHVIIQAFEDYPKGRDKWVTRW
jgi:dynein heavy chain